ncbi:MAG: hypothetical protein ACYTGZ_18230 [Planctomycetota bacterium]|jgi:hypothetical protein
MRWVLAVAAIVCGLAVAWLLDESTPRAGRNRRFAQDRPFERLAAVLGWTSEDEQAEPGDEEPERRRRAIRVGICGTPALLAVQRGWVDALNVYWGLPGRADDKKRARQLRRAWSQATDPIARQNLIFLIALTVPFERAAPWLREIAAQGSREDEEDVTVALAFSGDPAARARFLGLARSPARVEARRLVDHFTDAEKIATEGTPQARVYLRSYRAIDVLDRDPYFDEILVHARWKWLPHPGDPAELAAELLPAWLARYPGHPGSDDMALRLGAHHERAGRWQDALLWYARATTLPDQRVTTDAMWHLVRVAECDCSTAELDRAASDAGFSSPNRQLLQYIRVRRLAAEQDAGEGLRVAAAIAQDEPHSAIGVAWVNRWSVRAPRGLDSGLAPLPADDPLRVRGEWRDSREDPAAPFRRLGMFTYVARDRTPEQRLRPPAEPLRLDVVLLARQFRLWETVSELDRRVVRNSRGDGRTDLQYKAAALLYHDRDAFFPLYVRHHLNTTYGMSGFRSRSRGKLTRSDDEPPYWARCSVAYLRSLERFRAIERDDPAYTGMDKVLYSQGVLWRRLLDYRPLSLTGPGERERMRQLALAFEKLAATEPSSELAGPATHAARYWRWHRQRDRDG